MCVVAAWVGTIIAVNNGVFTVRWLDGSVGEAEPADIVVVADEDMLGGGGYAPEEGYDDDDRYGLCSHGLHGYGLYIVMAYSYGL